MTINKRAGRSIKKNIAFYIISIILTMLTSMVIVAAVSTGHTLTKVVDDFVKDYKVENAEFVTYQPLSDADMEKLEQEYDVILEHSRYKDVNVESGDLKGATIRVFPMPEKLNLCEVRDGHEPGDGEALLTQDFADMHDIRVGDTISLGAYDYKVSAYTTKADYIYMLDKLSGYIDSEKFALVVVDLGTALLIGADGLHAAGGGAGALVMMDRRIRAHVRTATALDALGLVDVGLAVHERDGALGADLAAGMRHAALAGIAHAVDVVLAGVAGEADDVDQRRLVVGLRFGRLRHALGEHGGLVHALQRKAHRQADALTHDRALDEDALAIGGHVARDDLVGQVVDPTVVVGVDDTVAVDIDAALVGDARDLFEDGAPDLGEVGVNPAHGVAHIPCPLSDVVQAYPFYMRTRRFVRTLVPLGEI